MIIIIRYNVGNRREPPKLENHAFYLNLASNWPAKLVWSLKLMKYLIGD